MFFFLFGLIIYSAIKAKSKRELCCHILGWESTGQSVKPEATSCQKRALLDVSSAIFIEVPREVQPISITDPAQPPFYSCCYPPDFGPSEAMVLLLTEHCAGAFRASG